MFRQEDLSLPEQQLASLQRVLVHFAHCLPTSKVEEEKSKLVCKERTGKKEGKEGV